VTAYLADFDNYRVRKVAAGTASTHAGNGTPSFGGTNGAATSASIFFPGSLIADNAGSLNFSDNGSSAIRKLSLSTGTLGLFAGNGFNGSPALDGAPLSASSGFVQAFTRDANGTFYFTNGTSIRKTSGGVYTTIANVAGVSGFSGDGGPAVAAAFSGINSLAVSTNGDLYVVDSDNNRVRVISALTGIVTTLAGTGTASSTGDGGLAGSATLNYPYSSSLDGAGKFVCCRSRGQSCSEDRAEQ